MTDNELIEVLIASLSTAITNNGYTYTPPGGSATPYPVWQKNQPTQQGIPTSPTVFFEKLFDNAYGFAHVGSVYNPTTQTYTETEYQPYRTTFQISAWAIQDPTNTALPTASDIANAMRGYLMSRANLRGWWTLDKINVERATEVRNPYIEDDRHRFEATPSFDMVITHRRTNVATIGAIFTATGTPNNV